MWSIHILLSIIGNSPIGKIVIDMQGHICVINDSALDLLGLTKSIDPYYFDVHQNNKGQSTLLVLKDQEQSHL